MITFCFYRVTCLPHQRIDDLRVDAFGASSVGGRTKPHHMSYSHYLYAIQTTTDICAAYNYMAVVLHV